MPLLSDREIRALLLFLPLAGLFVLLFTLAEPRRRPEPVGLPDAGRDTAYAAEPFAFDPNTVTYEELRRLGLAPAQAVSLLKYRAAGKIFRIPEDVALCYGIGDSLFHALRPYIIIGAEYAFVPRVRRDSARSVSPVRSPRRSIAASVPTPFRTDTVGAAYFAGLGFSARQAAVLAAFARTSRTMEEWRRCYILDDSVAALLEPCAIFPPVSEEPAVRFPVEINRADSAALRSVYGIGEKTVMAILDYRERLGGFVSVEQLAEVPGVTESNFEKISPQICCDSCEIRKIDINFATPNELRRHPYLSDRIRRKLLRSRQLKGGWSAVEELIDEHIMTPEEAARAAPYLRFDTRDEEH